MEWGTPGEVSGVETAKAAINTFKDEIPVTLSHDHCPLFDARLDPSLASACLVGVSLDLCL